MFLNNPLFVTFSIGLVSIVEQSLDTIDEDEEEMELLLLMFVADQEVEGGLLENLGCWRRMLVTIGQ